MTSRLTVSAAARLWGKSRQAHKDKAELAETYRAAFRVLEYQRPAPPAAGRFADALRGLFRRAP